MCKDILIWFFLNNSGEWFQRVVGTVNLSIYFPDYFDNFMPFRANMHAGSFKFSNIDIEDAYIVNKAFVVCFKYGEQTTIEIVYQIC
jgi:hypothetical protein